MNHFYAVFSCYNPSTASTNRMLSYLSAWSLLDINVTVVFMVPDRKFSIFSSTYPNIEILYMWEKFRVKNYFVHNLLLPLYLGKFKRKLAPGDNVYIHSDGYILSKLVVCKSINVFLEKTENPEVSNPGHWPFRVSIKKYLKLCGRLKGLFVISNPLKEYFASFGIPPEKIHIVNMTVDGARFKNIIKQKQKGKYIAYCGTATNNKDGVDLLIKSFSIISQNHPDISLYIIGDMPDRKAPGNNFDLAEKLGVADKCVFTGRIAASDMPQLLKDATILALNRPNNKQAKYGFPTKLGEYLLSENPVVVTRVGDIPLFIEDRVNGVLATPNNPEDFANQMEWLLDNEEKARQIGIRGRDLALSQFNNITEATKIVKTIIDGEF